MFLGKEIRFDSTARSALRRGMDRLAEAVRITLGPGGRSVMLHTGHGGPAITSDGATIAREIELPDPLENLGAGLGREVSANTRAAAGDGTSTAVVIAQFLVDEGLQAIEAGANPGALKRGMDLAREAALAHLRAGSIQLTSRAGIARIATRAAGGDVMLGERIAEAIERVGSRGPIRIEPGDAAEARLEITDGLQFDAGYLSPYFVNDPEEMQVRLEDCLVLAFEQAASRAEELRPALEAAAGSGRPLLLVGDELDGDALAALVVNRLRGALEVCAVRAPGFGERRREMLEDLALLTGGQFVSGAEGRTLSALGESALGRARLVTVDRDVTTVLEGFGASGQVEARRLQAIGELAEATGSFERDRLRDRLSRLNASIGVIRLAAEGGSDLRERRSRAEDALRATAAAVEEGVVVGGGAALARAASAIESLGLRGDEETGARILAGALGAPARSIAWNAGYEGAAVLDRLCRLDERSGFDVRTGEFVDFVEAGIVDPLKVVRVALQQAGNVAGIILTTEVLVLDSGERPDSSPPG